MKNFALLGVAALALSACSDGATETDTGPTEASTNADAVEIVLDDQLDGVTNEYCLDIAGGRENVDPVNGLQGHTCYSRDGALGTDQIFVAALFADNTLFMPEYDVCVSVEGTEIGLAACDKSEAQQVSFGEDGSIRPVADDTQCFTLQEDTRTGRSTENQIKVLALEPCAEDKSAYQVWRSRSSDDTPNS